MELGQTFMESLSAAGDSAFVPDEAFHDLVKCACQGVINEENRNMIADHPAFKDIDKAVLKEAYSGLVAFIIEAAKHDSSEQNISTLLEDCKFSTDRASILTQEFLRQKPHIQLLLGSIGSSFPHIVDVDWRLDYTIKSKHLDKINSAMYLITLKTEVPGTSEISDTQFSCSLEQLQDLVGKLKDVTKCLDKAAQLS